MEKWVHFIVNWQQFASYELAIININLPLNWLNGRLWDRYIHIVSIIGPQFCGE